MIKKLTLFGLFMILFSLFLGSALAQEVNPQSPEFQELQKGVQQLIQEGDIDTLKKLEEIRLLVNDTSNEDNPMSMVSRVIALTPWSAELPEEFPVNKELIINTLVEELNKSVNDPNQIGLVKIIHKKMIYDLNILLASAPTK